jgi:hypothetical protein
MGFLSFLKQFLIGIGTVALGFILIIVGFSFTVAFPQGGAISVIISLVIILIGAALILYSRKKGRALFR